MARAAFEDGKSAVCIIDGEDAEVYKYISELETDTSWITCTCESSNVFVLNFELQLKPIDPG